MIEDTFKKLEININLLKTPKITLNLMRIIRAGTIVTKQFYRFEPFLISKYKELYRNCEGDHNPIVQSEFLYMIAHTCYRNKKFSQSNNYLQLFSETLALCSKSFQKQLQAKKTLLTSANLVFTNNLKQGIENLQILYKNRKGITTEEWCNSVVSLGIYHFLNKDLKKAQTLLNELTHSDNWYKKTMGIEWVLKKNLMEIILYSELGHVELVESRIRSAERNYSGLKTNPLYSNAFKYLSLIKYFLLLSAQNPESLKKEILIKLEFAPFEQEDLQAMVFYAWIKSKALKQDYYTTLLKVVE